MAETQEFPGTITELGDKIANLKITEAVLLKNYLKVKYGIEPAAGGGMMAAAPVAAVEAVAPKTEFTVSLDGLVDAGKKIGVIKVVRELVSGLGLKEAKDLVEAAPKAVKENVSKEEAEVVKKKLEDAGAKVSIK
jgi:large subunit ribosomal protein L7/L12